MKTTTFPSANTDSSQSVSIQRAIIGKDFSTNLQDWRLPLCIGFILYIIKLVHCTFFHYSDFTLNGGDCTLPFCRKFLFLPILLQLRVENLPGDIICVIGAFLHSSHSVVSPLWVRKSFLCIRVLSHCKRYTGSWFRPYILVKWEKLLFSSNRYDTGCIVIFVSSFLGFQRNKLNYPTILFSLTWCYIVYSVDDERKTCEFSSWTVIFM